MSDKKSAFKLSSGLPFADTEVTITSASFGYTEMGGNSVLCLQLTGVNADGDEGEQSFSVGQGWEAVDGGARVQADNGREGKPFSKNSNIGKLIASAVKAVGGDPENMPFDDPTLASEWAGHIWETGTLSEVRKDFKGKVQLDDEGNPRTKDSIIFVRYVGAADGGKPATGGAATAAVKSKASGIDPELEAELIELAKAADDFDDFTDKGLDHPGVEGNAKATALVMSNKANGIWALAGKAA